MTKTAVTIQYLEEDSSVSSGYMLHSLMCDVPIKTMCYDFGPCLFTKTKQGLLMLTNKFPVSGMLTAQRRLLGYIASA